MRGLNQRKFLSSCATLISFNVVLYLCQTLPKSIQATKSKISNERKIINHTSSQSDTIESNFNILFKKPKTQPDKVLNDNPKREKKLRTASNSLFSKDHDITNFLIDKEFSIAFGKNNIAHEEEENVVKGPAPRLLKSKHRSGSKSSESRSSESRSSESRSSESRSSESRSSESKTSKSSKKGSRLLKSKHRSGSRSSESRGSESRSSESRSSESRSSESRSSESRSSESKTSKSSKKGSNSKSSKKGSSSKYSPPKQTTDVEAVRASLKIFVDSLNEGLEMDRGYHPNAADQNTNYNTCTIVQQCLDPDFILSLGRMSPRSRGFAYTTVSKVMSQESFNMLQLQQSSNMLLGEMQDWGTLCDGRCRELRDPDGLLERIVDVTLEDQSDPVPFLNYAQCGNLSLTKKTLWLCNDDPKMVHQANIDMSSGKYFLGNIWNEPHIHGRNLWYDYFSAYGDIEENGGAFGLRFSGHHIDLNYQWDKNGELINDMPVFLGHNPLIVPDVTPPKVRAHDEKASLDGFYPLLWENFAGVTQFQRSVELLLDVTNILLETAPGSYVPLSNWESNGYYGAIDPAGDRSVTDFEYLDLCDITESEFQTYWNLVEYTIMFARGHGSTEKERTMFREEGKVIWTTSSFPDTIPLTEYDLRSGMNFINVRIETDEWLFFAMSNQMFAVISEDMPSNHMHSIYVRKDLITADNACVEENSFAPGEICYSEAKTEFEDPSILERLSGPYKYETLMWKERNLKGRSNLNIDAFDTALKLASEVNCGLGFTATLFDQNAQQVYQKDVGTYYNPIPDGNSYFEGGTGDKTAGWTGDTTMTPYSNMKGVAASIYLAAVVDTGLGYLDEPIYLTLDYLTENDTVGKVTPRMILSHTSGLYIGNREIPLTDPYYICKYNETTTLGECLEQTLSLDDALIVQFPPGSVQSYNNEPFDILAELAVRKTGIESFGEIFRQYVAEPLGMDKTTYDCPYMKSTNEKPHVAWGACTTSNDFAKWVQMMSNDGMTPDGKQVISKYAITQMFSHGGGYAVNDGDWIWDAGLFLLMTRCYGRLYEFKSEFGDEYPFLLPLNSLVGYGLGTMFMLGNHGHTFNHGGSTGGYWFVNPGRYSGYIGWIATSAEFANAYSTMSEIFSSFEEASKFEVSKSNVLKESWEEIELCGGHDMYIDAFSELKVSSMSEFTPVTCPTIDGGRRATAVHPRVESFRKLLTLRSTRSKASIAGI